MITRKQNILPLHTPSTHGWGLKVETLLRLKVVMLHIKLTGMLVMHIAWLFIPFEGRECGRFPLIR